MDQKPVVDFFTEGCNQAGDNGWAAARFSSQQEQLATFHRLCSLQGLARASVLDVGCGQGDMYKFLVDAGFKGKYLGIDITPAMIEKAKAKNPTGEFLQADVFNLPDIGKFDYVIAAGCFNVKFTENQKEFTFKAVKTLFDISNIAVNMSLLSHHGYEIAKQFDCLVTYEPYEAVQEALKITPSIILDHASLPAEFILSLYH